MTSQDYVNQMMEGMTQPLVDSLNGVAEGIGGVIVGVLPVAVPLIGAVIIVYFAVDWFVGVLFDGEDKSIFMSEDLSYLVAESDDEGGRQHEYLMDRAGVRSDSESRDRRVSELMDFLDLSNDPDDPSNYPSEIDRYFADRHGHPYGAEYGETNFFGERGYTDFEGEWHPHDEDYKELWHRVVVDGEDIELTHEEMEHMRGWGTDEDRFIYNVSEQGRNDSGLKFTRYGRNWYDDDDIATTWRSL
jgi:hypothetical protein